MTGESIVEARQFFAHDVPRQSQREMLSDGIISLREGGFLLAAAPTGIGKTAAALASALEVTNFYNNNPIVPKIIFLTGRQSQHRIVVETVKQINSKLPAGLPRIRLVDIIGREGMCEVIDKSTGKCGCEEDVAESAIKARRAELCEFILSTPRHVDQSVKEGKARRICAWATARTAVRDAQILVCDYNHVFVESVRDSSLPAMGIELENSILIVDEAHNLPDRIRSGLERRITERIFQRALADVEEYKENLQKTERRLDLPMSKSLEDAILLEKQIKSLRDDGNLRRWFEKKTSENRTSRGGDIRIDTGEFLELVASAIESLDGNETTDWIGRVRMMNSRLHSVIIEEDEDLDEDEQNDCTRLAEILEICIRYRESTALALVFDNELDEPRVTSHLLDPSVVGAPIFNECAGSILMSGTLFPPQMYSDILGVPEENSFCKEYLSNFPSENRPILIAGDVTSKFTEREGSFPSIRDHIRGVLEETKGNVAVFSPSYAMMDRIHNDTSDWTFGKSIAIEDRRMAKGAIERMIASMYERRHMGGETVLFGVLSGKLSEGVDYTENILNAVVCVGLPLPPPSARQDALLEYYSARFGRSKAWKYASLQPAVNSVLQALGRPIRKKEDRAIIVLLESRFLENRVADCLPKSMQTIQTSGPNRTSERVKRFFEMS